MFRPCENIASVILRESEPVDVYVSDVDELCNKKQRKHFSTDQKQIVLNVYNG